jgi:hypothetical protein
LAGKIGNCVWLRGDRRIAVSRHCMAICHRSPISWRKCGFTGRDAVCVDMGNDFVMDDFIMVKSLR